MLFWLPLIASILLGGVAASAWYGGDKVLGLWLAFAGVVLLLLTGAIQIQHGIREDEAVTAAAAATQAKANEIAKRAYVSVSDATVSDLSGEIPPTVSVVIKNTGASPAYDLTWRATFAATESPTDEEIVLDRTKDAPAIILPTGEVLSYQWTFSQWEKGWNKKVFTGKAAIFAVGEISYKDAFGNPHSTKYRLIHGGDSLVRPGKFGPDKKGNEAD